MDRQLAEAVRKGTLKPAVEALNAGADPNTTYNYTQNVTPEMTPLMMAVAKKVNPEINEVLITNGADVNATNANGYTALHYAAAHNNVEAVRQLIAAHANLNGRAATFGYTPLHIAVLYGPVVHEDTTAIRLLLDAGADTTVKDDRGMTPLDIANQRGLREVAEMFREKEGLESGKQGAKVLSQEANNKSGKGDAPTKTQFAPRRREGRAMDAGRRRRHTKRRHRKTRRSKTSSGRRHRV